MPERAERLIFAQLGVKDGQTYTELLKNTGLDKDTFSKSLKKMKHDKRIRHKKKLYFHVFKIQNPLLLNLKETLTVVNHLERHIQLIKETNTPFDFGFLLIITLMRLLIKLSIEQHTAEKINSREKKMFEDISFLFNETIKQVFELLRKNNPKRMATLKKALEISMFDPNLLHEMKTLKDIEMIIPNMDKR
jgi:hypothetical protein